MVSDLSVVQIYTGNTKSLFAFPDDYRFRLARPTFPRSEQVVTYWVYPSGAERALTESELEDDGEFLWAKPTGVRWDNPAIVGHRLTVYHRPPMTQSWNPRLNSPLNPVEQSAVLDRIVRMIQAVASWAFGGLVFHPQETGQFSDSAVPLSGRTIPLVGDRKNTFLGFDGTGAVGVWDQKQFAYQVVQQLAGESGIVTVPSIQISGPMVFGYPSGSSVPSPATPKTLKAVTGNMTNPGFQWFFFDEAAWIALADQDGVAGSQTDSLTVSHDALFWGARTQVRLRCSASIGSIIVSDELTLFKIRDGVDAFTPILPNQIHGVSCRSDGSPGPGELGPTGKAKTTVGLLFGRTALRAVTTVPAEGEFRLVIALADGGTASLLGADTVVLDQMLADRATISLTLEVSGGPPLPASFQAFKVIPANVLYTVLESTNGDIFRVGEAMETTLIAHVFDTTGEVTASIPASRFRWRRVSAIQPNNDDLWNTQHGSGFKAVTITVSDVDDRATFFCDITD